MSIDEGVAADGGVAADPDEDGGGDGGGEQRKIDGESGEDFVVVQIEGKNAFHVVGQPIPLMFHLGVGGEGLGDVFATFLRHILRQVMMYIVFFRAL